MVTKTCACRVTSTDGDESGRNGDALFRWNDGQKAIYGFMSPPPDLRGYTSPGNTGNTASDQLSDVNMTDTRGLGVM